MSFVVIPEGPDEIVNCLLGGGGAFLENVLSKTTTEQIKFCLLNTSWFILVQSLYLKKILCLINQMQFTMFKDSNLISRIN